MSEALRRESLDRVSKTTSKSNRDRLSTLWRFHDPHVDRLAFGELLDPGGANGRNMDEDVLAAVIAGHEAEAPAFVEPFNFAAERNGRGGVGPPGSPPRPSREEPPEWPLDNS